MSIVHFVVDAQSQRTVQEILEGLDGIRGGLKETYDIRRVSRIETERR